MSSLTYKPCFFSGISGAPGQLSKDGDKDDTTASNAKLDNTTTETSRDSTETSKSTENNLESNSENKTESSIIVENTSTDQMSANEQTSTVNEKEKSEFVTESGLNTENEFIRVDDFPSNSTDHVSANNQSIGVTENEISESVIGSAADNDTIEDPENESLGFVEDYPSRPEVGSEVREENSEQRNSVSETTKVFSAPATDDYLTLTAKQDNTDGSRVDQPNDLLNTGSDLDGSELSSPDDSNQSQAEKESIKIDENGSKTSEEKNIFQDSDPEADIKSTESSSPIETSTVESATDNLSLSNPNQLLEQSSSPPEQLINTATEIGVVSNEALSTSTEFPFQSKYSEIPLGQY